MNRAKCLNCGFINFAGAVVCHKCQNVLQHENYQQQNFQQPQYPEQQAYPQQTFPEQQAYPQQGYQEQQAYPPNYNQQPQYQYPQNYQHQGGYAPYAVDNGNDKSSNRIAILVAVIVGIVVLGVIGAIAIPNMLAVKPKADWQAFKSESGKFSVMMPAKPKESSKPISSGQTMYIYTAEVSKEASAMVTYIDFPPELISRIPPDKLLESAAAGATSKSGATILKQQDIVLQGLHRGIELELLPPANVGSGKSKAICRVYLVNSRLYTVLITSEERSLIMLESYKFLESFQVTN